MIFIYKIFSLNNQTISLYIWVEVHDSDIITFMILHLFTKEIYLICVCYYYFYTNNDNIIYIIKVKDVYYLLFF